MKPPSGFGFGGAAWHNSITPTQCSRGEMDITTGFEPVIGGSNPSESTKVKVYDIVFSVRVSGYGLVVEHVLAKDETGVRFSLSAQRV